MRGLLLAIIVLCLVSQVEAQKRKLHVLRLVSASACRPVASVQSDSLDFVVAKDGSITISDSTGPELFFTRPKAMELFDLTSSAVAELDQNAALGRLEPGFKAGHVLARDGYNVDVGTPKQSDLGQILIFKGSQVRRTDLGLFYTIRYGGSPICVLLFVSEDIKALQAVFNKWESKHYH